MWSTNMQRSIHVWNEGVESYLYCPLLGLHTGNWPMFPDWEPCNNLKWISNRNNSNNRKETTTWCEFLNVVLDRVNALWTKSCSQIMSTLILLHSTRKIEKKQLESTAVPWKCVFVIIRERIILKNYLGFFSSYRTTSLSPIFNTSIFIRLSHEQTASSMLCAKVHPCYLDSA